jgi:hypothetical protein
VSITATYVAASAKVTVAVTSAPANASTVLLERSTDQVLWAAVRGTTPSVVLASGAYSVDDYEFSDAVPNYYRATYFDTTTAALVGTPAAATVTTSAGSSASSTPTMPTGLALGDTVLVALACTNQAGTVPAAPTGWTALAAATPNCLALYAADWTAALTMPAFTVIGIASGDKVITKAFSYRNVAPTAANVQVAVNAAAANIAFPAFTSLGGLNSGPLVLYQGSTHTSVSPVANYDDHATGYALMVYAIAPATYPAGSVAVTGGSSAVSAVIQANLMARTFVSQETSATVTPALTQVWVKNPIRPYLNRVVTVVRADDVVHKTRTGTFTVLGRTMPIAVSDLAAGRTTALTLRTTDRSTADDLESCLTTGDTQYLHSPKGSVSPTGYFTIGDLTKQRPSDTHPIRYFVLPLTEVAQPSLTLAAVQSTWQTVINSYATWQALITAKATWSAVLQLVGTPIDVITT